MREKSLTLPNFSHKFLMPEEFFVWLTTNGQRDFAQLFSCTRIIHSPLLAGSMRTNFVHFHRYYLIIHVLGFFLPWPSSVVQGRVKGISSSNRNSNKGGTKARSKGGAVTYTTNVTDKSAAKSAKGDSKSIGKGSKSTQEEPLSSIMKLVSTNVLTATSATPR